MTERVTAAWPKVHGTGRMFDNEKALLVCFAEKPTDDELRAFDDAIKGRSPELSAAPQPSINAEMLRVLGDIKVADLGSDENARWYVGVQTDRGCCSLRIEEPSAIEMFAEWKKSRDAIIAKAEGAKETHDG